MAYIRNYGNEVVEIKAGDRVCQIVFVRYADPDFKLVGTLPETARGDGGFGSTGRGAHEN